MIELTIIKNMITTNLKQESKELFKVYNI